MLAGEGKLNIVEVRSIEMGFISPPRNLRPLDIASRAMAPDPRKGSRIRSFESVRLSIKN